MNIINTIRVKLAKRRYYKEQDKLLEEEIKKEKIFSIREIITSKKARKEWIEARGKYKEYYEKYQNTKENMEQNLNSLNDLESIFTQENVTEETKKKSYYEGLEIIEQLKETQAYLEEEIKLPLTIYAYKAGKFICPTSKNFDLFRPNEMIPERYNEEYISEQEEENTQSNPHEYNKKALYSTSEEEQQYYDELNLIKEFMERMEEIGMPALWDKKTPYETILQIAKAWDEYGRQLTEEDTTLIEEYADAFNVDPEDKIIEFAKTWAEENNISYIDEDDCRKKYFDSLGVNAYEYLFITFNSMLKSAEEWKMEQEESKTYTFEDISNIPTTLKQEEIDLINEYLDMDINIDKSIICNIILSKITDNSMTSQINYDRNDLLTEYINNNEITLEELVQEVEQELLQEAMQWKQRQEEINQINLTLTEEEKALVNRYLKEIYNNNIELEQMIINLFENEAIEWQQTLPDDRIEKCFSRESLINTYIKQQNIDVEEWMNRTEQTLLLEARTWEAQQNQANKLTQEESKLYKEFMNEFGTDERFQNKNTREILEEARNWMEVYEHKGLITGEECQILEQYKKAQNITENKIKEMHQERLYQDARIWQLSEKAESLRLDNLTAEELVDVYLVVNEKAYYETDYEIHRELLEDAKEWYQNKRDTEENITIPPFPTDSSLEESKPKIEETINPEEQRYPEEMSNLVKQMNDTLASINTLVTASIENQNKILETIMAENNRKIDMLIEQSRQQQRIVERVLTENMAYGRSLAATLEGFIAYQNQFLNAKEKKKKKKKSKKKSK